MFRSPQQFRTFCTLLLTFALDLAGYSLVFPVLAPLLLNPGLHFFPSGTTEEVRTVVIGLLFALFGVAGFIGAPIAGGLADYYGRKRIFLFSIGMSVIGYGMMALSVYAQNLIWLFLGRSITGLSSGNASIVKSAVADLTETQHRSKAIGILEGVGWLGFLVGPWIGGKLANLQWLGGSSVFLFGAAAAVCNFLVILSSFSETWAPPTSLERTDLLSTFKDLRLVLQQRSMRALLITTLLFTTGWGFFFNFSPTFLVQKFSLGPDMIGNIFAYMALYWFLVAIFLNRKLAGKFSLPFLIKLGAIVAFAGIIFFMCPSRLWFFWVIIPIALFGGATGVINLIAMLSIESPEKMQGRAMGAWQSMWSLGQIISSLVAGTLAGWSLYAPLSVGAGIIVIALLYFFQEMKRVWVS